MRLPFLQVAQEEMARARTLAGYLSVPWQHAVGMVVALKAAALELAPEGDVSGVITDPNPAEWMAVQCGWPMDRADALAVALARCGFAMAGPQGGHSVAGLEPYRAALETAAKRSEAGRRGAEARKSKGGYGRAMAGPQPRHGQGMARDAQTQTQTQNETTLAGSDSRPPVSGTDTLVQQLEATNPPTLLACGNHPAEPESSPQLLRLEVQGAAAPPKRAPAAKAARKATSKSDDKPPDPRHRPLTDALCAAFLEATGAAYSFTPRSAKTVQLLLLQADSAPDTRGEAAHDAVLQRWCWGLSWVVPLSGRRPVQTLEDLLREWNRLNRPPPEPEQPRNPNAPTAGACEWDWTSSLPKEASDA